MLYIFCGPCSALLQRPSSVARLVSPRTISGVVTSNFCLVRPTDRLPGIVSSLLWILTPISIFLVPPFLAALRCVESHEHYPFRDIPLLLLPATLVSPGLSLVWIWRSVCPKYHRLGRYLVAEEFYNFPSYLIIVWMYFQLREWVHGEGAPLWVVHHGAAAADAHHPHLGLLQHALRLCTVQGQRGSFQQRHCAGAQLGPLQAQRLVAHVFSLCWMFLDNFCLVRFLLHLFLD